MTLGFVCLRIRGQTSNPMRTAMCPPAARTLYDQALARNPALADVWLVKGIGLSHTEPEAAARCFRMAINVGTDSVTKLLAAA